MSRFDKIVEIINPFTKKMIDEVINAIEKNNIESLHFTISHRLFILANEAYSNGVIDKIRGDS